MFDKIFLLILKQEMVGNYYSSVIASADITFSRWDIATEIYELVNNIYKYTFTILHYYGLIRFLCLKVYQSMWVI